MTPEANLVLAAVLRGVSDRIMAADNETVTIDHAAIEAVVALEGLLFNTDNDAAVITLGQIALELLAELPKPAPYRAFQNEWARRTKSMRQPANDVARILR